MNDFLSWCRKFLVPLLFHDLISLHPPSFHGNDFSTSSSYAAFFIQLYATLNQVDCLLKKK